MIDILPYGIGFVFYVSAIMFSFRFYLRKTREANSLENPFAMYFIYLYYTILAGYVINFVDSNEIFSVKFIQVAIYAIAAGGFLHVHYKTEEEKQIDVLGFN